MDRDEERRQSHHLYYVMDGESLVEQHRRAQTTATSPSLQRRSRRSSSVLETIGLTTHHLVRPQSWFSKILRFKYLIMIVGTVVLLIARYNSAIGYAEWTIHWISDNPKKGSLLTLAITITTSMLCIPISSVIGIGCGFAYFIHFGWFGIGIGATLYWLGSSVGAVFAFLISRHVLRGCVLKVAEKSTKFDTLERMIQRDGVKCALLIRSMPLPLEVQNYVLGVTSISPISFFFSLIAMVPGCIFYVIIGSMLGHISNTSSLQHALRTSPVLICSGVISLVLMVGFSCVAATKFSEMEQDIEEIEVIEEIDLERGMEVKFSDLIAANEWAS